MNIVKLVVFIEMAAVASGCSSYRHTADTSQSDMETHIEFLASDELEGRYPGTEGDLTASKYIEAYLKLTGLETGRQEFSFTKSVRRGPGNTFLINGIPSPSDQFTPFSFSADTLLNARVVFCGFGITVKTDSFEWDDYKGADVKGKWVMALRGIPDVESGGDYLSLASDDRDKAMTAMDHGAAGLILVSGEKFDAADKLAEVSRKQAVVGIPVFHIKRSLADEILKNNQLNIIQLEIESTGTADRSGTEIQAVIEASADIDEIRALTFNIYGILEGSDPLYKKEYIIIGAHYDHLGAGGPGSSSRRQEMEGIHNGADDNASGVAMMMELASRLKERQTLLKRSCLFVAFGAEEMGLLGSKHFVKQMPVDPASVVTMVNLDMVGRLDTARGIQIGGTGTSLEADSLLMISNRTNLKLRTSKEGSGPSDHSSFYGKNIPVFFISTGAHSDYHTPDDDADRINFDGMEVITDFTYDLISAVDKAKLTFTEAGPKETTSGPGYRFKVTLGFMPDFSATDIEGVRVDFVSKGKAAERGGIKNGDIIKAIDGLPVKNIYDYMYRLGKLSKNQIISVEVLRGDKKEVLLIQL